MKKTLAIALLATLTIGMTACGSKPQNVNTDYEKTESNTESSMAPAVEDDSDDIDITYNNKDTTAKDRIDQDLKYHKQ